MRQVVYQNLSVSQLEANFEEIMASGYSVSFFNRWIDRNIDQVWIKYVIKDEKAEFQIEPDFFGAKVQTEKVFPIAGFSSDTATG